MVPVLYKKDRLMPADIQLLPKFGASHLYIFEEGAFYRKNKYVYLI
jgi:hypothetical protein